MTEEEKMIELAKAHGYEIDTSRKVERLELKETKSAILQKYANVEDANGPIVDYKGNTYQISTYKIATFEELTNFIEEYKNNKPYSKILLYQILALANYKKSNIESDTVWSYESVSYFIVRYATT